MAEPSIRIGSKAWMPRRCRVGRAVEQHRTILDDVFERFPDLGAVAFDQAAGALDVGGVVVLDQAGNDERAIKFQAPCVLGRPHW